MKKFFLTLILISLFTNIVFSQIVSTSNRIFLSSILTEMDTVIWKKPGWIETIANRDKLFINENSYKSRLFYEKKLYLTKEKDEFLKSIIDTASFYCVDSFGNQLWRKTIVPQKTTNSISHKLIHSTKNLLSIEISSMEEDVFFCDGIVLNSKPSKKTIVFFDMNGKLLPYKFEVENPHIEDLDYLVSNMTEDNTFAYLFKKQGDFSINQSPFIAEDGIYIALVSLDKSKKEYVISKSQRIGDYSTTSSTLKFRYNSPFEFSLRLSEQKKVIIYFHNKHPDYAKIIDGKGFDAIRDKPKIVLFDENLMFQNSFNLQTKFFNAEFDNSGNLYVFHSYVDTSFYTIKYVLTVFDSKGKIRINDTIENGLEFQKFVELFNNKSYLQTFVGGCFVVLPTTYGKENRQGVLRIKQYFINGDKPRFFESHEVSLADKAFLLSFNPIASTPNSLTGITPIHSGKISDFENGYTIDKSINSGYSLTTFTIDESKYDYRNGFTSIKDRNFSFYTIHKTTLPGDTINKSSLEVYIRPYDTINYNISIVKEDGSVLNQTKKPQKGLRTINLESWPKGKYTIVVTSVDEKLKNTYDFEVE